MDFNCIEKECTKCGNTKPLKEYHYIKKDSRYHSWCKECVNRRKRTKENYLNKIKNGHYKREDVKKRRKAYSSMRSGFVEKKVCVICGIDKTEAHHENYDKPKDVVWLCRKHHLQYHYKKLNRDQIEAIKHNGNV